MDSKITVETVGQLTAVAQAQLAAAPGSPFAPEVPEPLTDRDALAECADVLERIMRDNLLCGTGTIRLRPDNKIELPLYGCARRALAHARQRMANREIERKEVR
jgi:hypothetical protein